VNFFYSMSTNLAWKISCLFQKTKTEWDKTSYQSQSNEKRREKKTDRKAECNGYLHDGDDEKKVKEERKTMC